MIGRDNNWQRIRRCAVKGYRKYRAVFDRNGITADDVFQELAIVHEAALASFDDTRSIPFDPYFTICANRHVMNMANSYFTQSRQGVNEQWSETNEDGSDNVDHIQIVVVDHAEAIDTQDRISRLMQSDDPQIRLLATMLIAPTPELTTAIQQLAEKHAADVKAKAAQRDRTDTITLYAFERLLGISHDTRSRIVNKMKKVMEDEA